MATQAIELPARDLYPLAATLFEPDNGEAAVTVVVAGAVAVSRRFYDSFARFLCQSGIRVVSFDYRGIGESLRGDVRASTASMSEWGEKDLAGVIDAVLARFPDSKLAVVGHSAGGQLLGIADNNRRVDALLAVCAQSGYWGHWPRPSRYVLATLWFAIMPGLACVLAHFPARRLGLGENLPRGVAREWSSWCRAPEYIFAHRGAPERFNAFAGRILAFSFEDDWMAPSAAVDALLGRYTNASTTRRHIAGGSGVRQSVGHFGFFKPRSGAHLWAPCATWLADEDSTRN